jgi:chromosome transmission fidelity protein 8
MPDRRFQAKPTLRVSHHLLEGKIATLSKPLAVLRSAPNLEQDATSPVSFDMVAIIHKKIIFSKRPSPIVNLVPTEETQEPSKRKRAL